MATPLYARYLPPYKPSLRPPPINPGVDTNLLEKKRKRAPAQYVSPQDDTPPKKSKKKHSKPENGSKERFHSLQESEAAASVITEDTPHRHSKSVDTSLVKAQSDGEKAVHYGPPGAIDDEKRPKKSSKKRKSEGDGGHETADAQIGGHEYGVNGLNLAIDKDDEVPLDEDLTKSYPAKPEKRKKKTTEQTEGSGVPTMSSDKDEAEDPKYKTVLSKYKKSTSLSERLLKEGKIHKIRDAEIREESVELHGLEPLPEPEQNQDILKTPTFATLPPWLSQPMIIPGSTSVSFASLGISRKLLTTLAEKGYQEAFAVQSAVLPLLLPGPTHHYGDLCVAAATGSGKTLSYVLPMVESLRGNLVTRLRGIIVVPTRELVAQVRDTFELCSIGSGLKVEIAAGNRPLKTERRALVKRGQKYSPVEYRKLKKPLSYDEDNHNDELAIPDPDELIDLLPDHVPDYTSNIDILICTPGRLVDHTRSTSGFTLDYVQWLVIDEADRLLNQSFQEWIDTVIPALESQKPYDQLTERQKFLTDAERAGNLAEQRLVTKVVLSATMTRDVGKLLVLNLKRPKLVVVENTPNARPQMGDELDEVETAIDGGFELPRALEEYAVPIGDGNEKPLYLLQLLRASIFTETRILNLRHEETLISDTSSDSSSSSDSEDFEDLKGDSISSLSETDSFSDDMSSDISSTSSSESSDSARSKSHPRNTQKSSATDQVKGVLIFTNNNENAIRLSRLLSLLDPAYEPMIGTLTKSLATSAGRKTLATMRSGKIQILIASDRASRGLDLPNIKHIVNYDIPTSITAYVHRVGRTARAGKEGIAWSFLQHTEARWFWNEIARGTRIRRVDKVQRVKIDLARVSEEDRNKYQVALSTLKEEVQGHA